MLNNYIENAKQNSASDLHIEPGLPLTIRVNGELKEIGESLTSKETISLAKEIINNELWHEFQEQGSFDLACTIAQTRCRINALYTMRGVGLAIRLLPSIIPTVNLLNLHPDLAELVNNSHGLLLISGTTGSGKSSTLAALLQEINLRKSCHIITIEQPIEYALRPKRSLIRQREVGRDTPSFEQALKDSLREDPDVIVVGEIREPEVLRLTLNAAETGHLVIATMHSSNVAEVLQRIVMSFPAEKKGSIAGQIADCLIGIICQRLVYKNDIKIRVPECEILKASTGVKAIIRLQDFFKIESAIETGGKDGMWTWERYRNWLNSKKNWSFQKKINSEVEVIDYQPVKQRMPVSKGYNIKVEKTKPVRKQNVKEKPIEPFDNDIDDSGVIVIDSTDDNLDDILSELEDKY